MAKNIYEVRLYEMTLYTLTVETDQSEEEVMEDVSRHSQDTFEKAQATDSWLDQVEVELIGTVEEEE